MNMTAPSGGQTVVGAVPEHDGAIMRLKVKLIGAGTRDDPLRVNLPHYIMISGTDDEKMGTVEVLVPRRLTENGHLSEEKIRSLYRNHVLWDRDGITDGIEVVV